MKNREISRKFIHIGFSFWPFIAFNYFTSLATIVSIPVMSIFVNYIATKKNILPFMMRDDISYGTLWYAISLTLLTTAGFLTNNPDVCYFGFLTMTLGDGFAAALGTLFGKKKIVFMKESTKSYLGVFVLFCITFILSIVYVQRSSMLYTFLTAMILAQLAVFIEIFGQRGTDNFFLPLGITLAASLFLKDNSLLLMGAILITESILLFAYNRASINENGTATAIFVALLLLKFGELPVFIALLVFFIFGSAISKIENKEKMKASSLHESTGTRGVVQVIMNSAPALLILLIGFILQADMKAYNVLALVAFAVSTADTFASEIGMLSKGNTYSILRWKKITPGLSGGVSLLGFAASVLGAGIIALIGWVSYSFMNGLFILVMGVVGAIIDSILGETIQVKFKTPNGEITEKKLSNGQQLEKQKGLLHIDNNLVNMLSNVLTLIVSFFLYAV